MKCFTTPTETIVMRYVQAIKKVDGFQIRGKTHVQIYLLQISMNGGTTYEQEYEDKIRRDNDYSALQDYLTNWIKE